MDVEALLEAVRQAALIALPVPQPPVGKASKVAAVDHRNPGRPDPWSGNRRGQSCLRNNLWRVFLEQGEDMDNLHGKPTGELMLRVSLPVLSVSPVSPQAIAVAIFQAVGAEPAHPVACYSRVLTPVKQKFGPCERECVAAVWALEAVAAMVRDSPIVMQSSHTLLPCILSAKLTGSDVSSPWLAQWTLALVNHGVQYKSTPGIRSGSHFAVMHRSQP
ncbi:unnamed protein product [Caretta caretta]